MEENVIKRCVCVWVCVCERELFAKHPPDPDNFTEILWMRTFQCYVNDSRAREKEKHFQIFQHKINNKPSKKNQKTNIKVKQ